MTPMMEQWSELKSQAGEALLFFRLGDFYELFAQDAVKAAPLMGVALTSRNSKSEDSTPLCGVPIQHFQGYLTKLLDAGQSVALAEQVEEPGPGKKIVKREIVQWFTPGIRLLEQQESPAYAAVVAGQEKDWVMAAADVATGDLAIERGSGFEALQECLERNQVRDLRTAFGQNFQVTSTYQASINLLSEKEARNYVLQALQLLEAADAPCSIARDWIALGSLIKVLQEAHPRENIYFRRPQEIENAVQLSAASRRHLHLFEPNEYSLFNYMDETKMALGRRKLKFFLANPTQDKVEIFRRQEAVHFWKANPWLRQQLRQHLSAIHDLPRLLRLRSTPLRLFQLKKSLLAAFEISKLVPQDSESFARTLNACSKLEGFLKILTDSLDWSDQPDRGWIKLGVHPEIDELRKLQTDAESVLLEFENRMRSELQISTLKIRFHQVFGYVAEVTRQHAEKIPSEYKQIQSLANSIRFKNGELTQLEEKLLSLESRLLQAEQSELEKLFDLVISNRSDLENLSECLAELDVFQSLAELSVRESWSRPELAESSEQVLELERVVHPLSIEDFVPLSFELRQNGCYLMLLTGPNMAGKSTVLRLAALSAILHQMGSDVPAQKARLSIFDRIMCRMGAMDDLTQGKSTFYVEMKEVASMLQGASTKSLLLFDEIGRGTSTYDGMSLAWAITEGVHELGCLSVVATHYLELAALEKTLKGLSNFHLGVKEIDSQLIFTRKLVSGPASQSYGIQVARLAALPESVLARASEKLKDFESKPAARKKATPLFDWVQSHAENR